MFNIFKSSNARKKSKVVYTEPVSLEGTMAIIKPDAFSKAEEIVQRIKSEGFIVVAKREFRFNSESVKKYFGLEGNLTEKERHTIQFMTSGPVMGLCLAREDGIRKLKRILGPANVEDARENDPESLRAIYGTDDVRNAVHGSQDPAGTEREIGIVFPYILSESGRHVTPERILNNKEYLETYVCPTLTKGLKEMYERNPENPVVWLADWLVENNPNVYT